MTDSNIHTTSAITDERELLVGDPLGKRVSEAIESARAVLVVISKASVSSNWLSFELNQATSRMIKGECRVIPIVIDSSPIPAEVRGLLYADFTGSFAAGSEKVMAALQAEVHTLEQKARHEAIASNFWKRAKLAVQDVFGSVSYCSLGGEYESIDYDIVSLPIPSDDSDETDIVFESISGYGDRPRPLADRWWDEYRDAMDRIPATLFLVVSERQIIFAADQPDKGEPLLKLKTLRSTSKYEPTRHVVLVDAANLSFDAMRSIIEKSHALFRQLVQSK